MKALIVSAANQAYFPLLYEMLWSLHQWGNPGLDLAVFDLGISDEARDWLSRHVQHQVHPGWDLPVAAELRKTHPHMRAITVRPFLPRYFPGYDVYLWIDADVWVQEREAVADFVTGAKGGKLAVAVQNHPAYMHTPRLSAWRSDRMKIYFGDAATDGAEWEDYVNGGVYALEAHAPHWARWALWFEAGLARDAGRLVCDQTALNYAVWRDHLAVTRLDARHNWLCHLAEPLFDAASRKWRTPDARRQAIGLLHLTGSSKFARQDGAPAPTRFQGAPRL